MSLKSWESPKGGAVARDVDAALDEDALRDSHGRSLGFGLSVHDAPDFTSASPAQMGAALEQNRRLFGHALPIMETLYQQIRNTHNMVILTDSQGLILHSFGDDDFLARADKVALRPGVYWSEQSRGTNANGTALVLGEPTVVHATQHYLRVNHFLTCSCTSIVDPCGTIVGALDVTGEHRSYHKHTMALVRMSAQMIENQFFSDAFGDAIRVHFHTRPEFIGTLVEGIAAFRADGKFLSSNRSGQFQRGMSQGALRAHTFQSLFGLSMATLFEQLRTAATPVLSCHMHNGVAVYLRAELSRSLTHVAAVPPEPNEPRRPAAPAPGSRLSYLRHLNTGDPRVARVLAKIDKVLGRDIPLLITGETGTGKELLARAVHNDSPRHSGPFVAINRASIPETLIESELFGYIEGAFTGGRKRGNSGKILAANGGTLFLDEIGDMPIALQARLLRVLQERLVNPLGTEKTIAVDFALICATHRNLRSQIEQRAFREDLYYRINGLVVRLPPLRERTDLEVIVKRIVQSHGKSGILIEPEVMELFRRYPWPGNLRQLTNLLRTSELIIEADGVIRKCHLPDDFLEEFALESAIQTLTRRSLGHRSPARPSAADPRYAHGQARDNLQVPASPCERLDFRGARTLSSSMSVPW